MKRPGVSRVVGGLTGGALVCLLVSCGTPESRYRFLSFVFDGVPPPPGMAVALTGESERPPYSAKFNGGLSVAALGTIPEAPVTILSVHKPVEENKCQECHDSSIGFDRMPLHDARLCDKCHLEQRERQGWNHGPINLGSCIPCHLPHESRYEHLLSKPVPDICLTCHQEDLERPEEYHAVPNVDQCVACHDPHRMY